MTENEYAFEQMRQIKIMKHLKDSTGIKCENCGSQVFKEGYLLRKISKLLTGESNDIIQPIPVFTCSDCGHINSDFKPKDFPIDEATDKISDEG
jgi:DNA-directed RNA polymerase subunit RPC12/RpoP